ncbi:ribonuclease E/G [Gammaproteobacteria bacterium 45_16_T64]|nr:ribonuclease E/G [Gammaproteobacteria bacterium 45_16_T64]
MSEEILINVTPMETRVAIIENGVVQEIFLEREAKRGLVGSIFQGKVVRVLPGMQAAFVDVGLERAAFLHAKDIWVKNKAPTGDGVEVVPNIRDLLQEGQHVVVQITKDMIGTKGARLTTHLSIPSRYLVFMPFSDHLGISQRIEDEGERGRLRTAIDEILEEESIEQGLGFILRTAADGVDKEALRGDVLFLWRMWCGISERAKATQKVSKIHEDLPLYMRTLRDEVRDGVEKVRIDSRETYAKIIEFAREYTPSSEALLDHYPGERPIFDLYGVEQEIQKALSREVQLKSGGYLVVDQTEAMTTVDVNTGAFVGHRNLEETIFKTNLEAAQAIARQLRLRNLGGIIIIDFIDMEDAEHRRQVLRIFEKVLERDRAKTKVTQVSELGLVEMTRKRTRESLQRTLCEDCSTCNGRGFIKTAETACFEIFREILRQHRAYDAESYLVIASQDVVDRLLDEESANVADVEEFIGKTIRYQVEALYCQEQFDVVLV